MKPKEPAGCALCPFEPPLRVCQKKDGKAPPFCPTENWAEVIEEAQKELDKPEILEFAKQASIQEGEGYANRELGYDHVRPAKPRIVEVTEFAGKMGYKTLGLSLKAPILRDSSN